MTSITLKETVLGQGQPKIIVPLTGDNEVVVYAQALTVWRKRSCDLIEWRLDYFYDLTQVEKMAEMANELSTKLAQPVILTLRTADEGGQANISAEEYFKINKYLIENARFDAIDLQLSMPEDDLQQLVNLAHEHQIKVIMSYHNFDETPEMSTLEKLLESMQASKADIGKIAVMPKNKQDVLDLLKVTAKMADQLNIPLITMSMGDLGKVTRTTGQLFGSVATFGIAVDSSAPGQIKMGDLKKALEIFSKTLV